MVIEASTGQAHQMADDGDVQRRERGFAGIMPQHAGGHEENEQSPTGEGGDEGGMITKGSRHPDGRRVETADYVEKTTKRKPAVYKSYDISNRANCRKPPTSLLVRRCGGWTGSE